ncbi:hypothetical protein HK097_009893 [Rhizophlyctis rosea]|uniref:Potassium channel tetramerisation-type BTB domain-containing protein n=1 Tax=Rhizophlyctis rosea TaxID=64517 RepID=A0AAD5S9V0_9FUNG|nr:hypothetical protein HK097_009893 [Rhizophlyctis rosea]
MDLYVGGTHFRTTRTTLFLPGSMLARLVSNHWKEGALKGAIFIDQNPEIFILDYLRTGTIDQQLPAD